MAVYTDISNQELSTFLEEYAVGHLIAKTPIAEGIENSNFLVETDRGLFILTIFEKRVRSEDLPFFMALTSYVASKGLPAATPLRNKDGRVIQTLAGKPAALIEHLPGAPKMKPGPVHCVALGEMLADMHNCIGDFDQSRLNPLSLDSWHRLAGECRPRADECADGLAAFIDEELAFLSTHWPSNLPGGVVHTDLFPDNVLFQGDEISGVIDFYFSCTDAFAYDFAICVNAWCFDQRQAFQQENLSALMSHYQNKRPLTDTERSAFPIYLRGAALRFLLTRLYDWLNRVDGALVTVKNPLDYQNIIRFHRGQFSPSLFGI